MASFVSRLGAIIQNGPRSASESLLLKLLQLNGHLTLREGRPKNFNAMLMYIETHKINMLYPFDVEFYKNKYVDIQGTNIQALRHFLLYGQFEGRDPSPLFDTQFYISQLTASTDIKSINLKSAPAFLHFLNIGWKQGIDPSRFFHTTWYINNNTDVLSSGINPLFHYLAHGLAEGRAPHPEVDLRWYAKRYLDRSEMPGLTLIDLVNNYPSKATSEADYNKRFGYRVLSGGIKKSDLNIKPLSQNQLAELTEPPTENTDVTFPDIQHAQFLTVDIWDTILRRDCHPDEIKLQTSRNLLLQYKNLLRPYYRHPTTLLRARFEAEREVATEAYEYDIKSAFTRWIEITTLRTVKKNILDQILDSLLDCELAAERRSTRLDNPAYRSLQRYMKPKYFASDFYAPSDFMRQVLSHHGAGDLFVGGFVSCETFETKREGELYGRISKQLDVKPSKDWTHVGDNKHADVEKALDFGITAKCYENRSELNRTHFFHKAYDDVMNQAGKIHELRLQALTENIARRFEMQGDRLAAIGARLSPIVIGFVLSVLEDAISEHISDVYFFTREGKFFLEIAQKIATLNPYHARYPKLHLLEVSRRATFAASVAGGETEDFMRMWSLYSSQSPRSFAASLNLDTRELEAACRRVGISPDAMIKYPWQDPIFQRLLWDGTFKAHLQACCADQRRQIRAYLDKVGLGETSNKPFSVVDIGWRGTIQDSLSHIIRRPSRGHYLGLFKYLNKQPEACTKFGWLYNENSEHIASFVSEVAPLEMLFNCIGGSITHYEDIDGNVQPVRQVAEKEDKVVYTYIEPMQRGMVEATADVVNYVRLHGLMSLDLRELAQSLVVDLSNRPPVEFADAFLALEHNETFGTGELEIIHDEAKLRHLLEHCIGAELHHQVSAIASDIRWPEALYGCSLVSQWWNQETTNRRLAAPLAISAFQVRRSSRADLGRVCVYAPSPIIGSGGHRTIMNAAKAAQALGFELHCLLDGQGDGIELIEDWLGDTPAVLHSQWHKHIPCDYALATVAHSAKFVADLPYASHKGYLVQDFEASFNPLSNGYVVAENSYVYGLTHHTVGRWLSHVIGNLTGGSTISSGLGVDTNVYLRDDGSRRERSICFLHQPEKPRRLTEMALAALSLVKKSDPSVTIYAFGSNQSIKSDVDIVNLGLIHDLKKLNKLYNLCSVGLCLSLTNPSRIPFEMMASGCIPVDLFRYNNLFDYVDGTAVLAYQSAESVAAALMDLLALDEDRLMSRSRYAQSQVLHRTLSWEGDVIANTILAKIENRSLSDDIVRPTYTADPFLAVEDDRGPVRAFCEHQVRLAKEADSVTRS